MIRYIVTDEGKTERASKWRGYGRCTGPAAARLLPTGLARPGRGHARRERSWPAPPRQVALAHRASDEPAHAHVSTAPGRARPVGRSLAAAGPVQRTQRRLAL